MADCGPAGSGNDSLPERFFLTGWRVETNQDFQFHTQKLTFSSAETSAILGSGVGARFFINNKTSREKKRRQAGYRSPP